MTATLAASTPPTFHAPGPAMPPAYPAHREADVVLADGTTAHIRPIKPEDEPRLAALFASWSVESLVLRFFSAGVDAAALARRFCQVDYATSFGLVAVTGPEERIVAHGSYATCAPQHAEVAFGVAEDFRGRGLATILLAHLAEIAAANGITTFEAEVLPQNHGMLAVFRDSGFRVEVRSAPDSLHVTLPTSLTADAIERFEQRERLAAVAALRAFFQPRAVAVVGASRSRGTVGGELFHNLLEYQFAGPVYPVNPTAPVVQCVPAYPTVEAIPGPVDLAVIAVPAPHVSSVAEQCGRKGVHALVVISAGFAETGEPGRQRQRELLEVCRRYGMRVVGPNCIGIVNADPNVRLNAMFGPLLPESGGIAFSSQSGALGLAAMEYAAQLGLGISSFVSTGNKADVSGNDLLNYWETDPRTKVILLYLESFGNPRKFSRIARRVGRQKPVVVVKSGRSAAGARATSSHTGALLAASDVTVDALFRQAGVIRTDTLRQFFDVASLLASQPLPAGRRVGIITNGGGPGILCADACEGQGLAVPALSDETQAALRAFLPREAGTSNPVDMIATATAEQYARTVRTLAADPSVDSLVVIFLRPLVTRAEDVARAVLEVARDGAALGGKPLLAVFMAEPAVRRQLATADVTVPAYDFPESAAIALAHATRYAEWRAQPVQPAYEPAEARRDEAAALISAALGRHAEDGGWLTPEEIAALFSCYRVPLAEQRLADTPEQAGEHAAALGGPVALKAVAPGLVHKTDVGGVRLGLRGAGEVAAAAREMRAALAERSVRARFLVQPMVAPGVDMIVGIVQDPQFGPVVACGAGGTLVEVLRDVSVRLAPLTRADSTAMVRELRSYPLLTGHRGAVPADVPSLEEILLRIGALAEDLPQIAELDCNPVAVHAQGAVVVDARVRVTATDPPRPLGARRLA